MSRNSPVTALHTAKSLQCQKGIGIIEIMIALLVLTIGLLGMASMQTNGLQMTSEALSRSQATILANDIIDRARANRENLDDYQFPAAETVPACDTSYAWDGSLSIAENDIDEWMNSLACLLPSPDATVVFNDASNLMTVTVTWNSRSDIANDGQITVRAQL